MRLLVRSWFLLSIRRLRLERREKLIGAWQKKIEPADKAKKSRGKSQRKVEPGKERFRVKEGIHADYPVAGQFENDQGPRLVPSFRIGPVLSERGPTASRRANQARSAASTSQTEHPRPNILPALQPK